MSATPHPTAPVRPRKISTNRRAIQGRAAAPAATIVTPLYRRRALTAIAVLLIAAIMVYELGGLNDLRKDPVTGVDYVPVAEYVAARHKPGEPILTALPPPAYLAVGSAEDLIFLSSPLDRKRAQRYTRLTSDGRYVDYWTGADSVVDVAGLCNTLLTEPKVWILVDQSRLAADWAFLGPMADVINGMTYVQFTAPGGAQVRRLSPAPARDPAAEAVCTAAMAGQPIPTAVPTEAPAANPPAQ
jgi:hypothetical protein